MDHIPFNRPYAGEAERQYLEEVLKSRSFSGNGRFTQRCEELLCEFCEAKAALICHSGTAALEMATILADIAPGDEVIMPSFTFVSTANAVVLRGATPVFIDIRRDTLNLDERLVEEAITGKTRAIMPVHYAGVACEFEELERIASKHDLYLLADAAQCIGSSWRGRPTASLGDCAALSFHETKNITCGEGGALLINRSDWVERAEIIWEKGTNRARFFRGQVDKYTWVDIGSSFLASELAAAFLVAQLERLDWITARRSEIWNAYHSALAPLEDRGLITRPSIPSSVEHNAHIYHILLGDGNEQQELLAYLKQQGIGAVFHYVPLDSSTAGQRWGKVGSDLRRTYDISNRLVRLPLWPEMEAKDVERVVRAVSEFFQVA